MGNEALLYSEFPVRRLLKLQL